MAQFQRTFTFIEELKNEPLFLLLKEDVKKGVVFPAVRRNSVQFYYKGNLLFRYGKDGFSTHFKYAVNTDWRGVGNSPYVYGGRIDPTGMIVSDFVSGYACVKKNIDIYAKAKPEAALTSGFYARSFFKEEREGGNWLIDIEAAFERDDGEAFLAETQEKRRKGIDRVDAVIYNARDREIVFCEVKRFDDERIKAKSRKSGRAEVVGQLERYQKQIASVEEEIVEGYRRVFEIFHELFGTEVFPVERVKKQAVLFVTGYDKNGALYEAYSAEDVAKIRAQGQAVVCAYKASGTPLDKIARTRV